jgi:hypothetical protein
MFFGPMLICPSVGFESTFVSIFSPLLWWSSFKYTATVFLDVSSFLVYILKPPKLVAKFVSLRAKKLKPIGWRNLFDAFPFNFCLPTLTLMWSFWGLLIVGLPSPLRTPGHLAITHLVPRMYVREGRVLPPLLSLSMH